MELKQVVAKNISELRRSAGMTQLELAEILNYSDKAVSKWESGASLPDVGVLLQIANTFGVTVDYLCERDGEVMLAENDAERRLLTMFRRTDGLSDERREEITEYIGSTIDMYLRAIAGDGESGGRGI